MPGRVRSSTWGSTRSGVHVLASTRGRWPRDLLEDAGAAQPIVHPRHRLALLEEARPPLIVTAYPGVHVLVCPDGLLELKPVGPSRVDHVGFVHRPIVAPPCDAERGVGRGHGRGPRKPALLPQV